MRQYHEVPDGLKERYGQKGHPKQIYHRAIRGEFAFGSELLDFKEVLYKLGFRRDNPRETTEFLQESYRRIDVIVNILINEIDRRYENPELPDNSFQAIDNLELWLKDLNEYKMLDIQHHTKKIVNVTRRLVKTVIKRYLEGEKEQSHSQLLPKVEQPQQPG